MTTAEGLARLPSRCELRVDGALHAAALAASLVGAAILIAMAISQGISTVATVAIYCAGLLTMLVCSAAYNLGGRGRLRERLRALDQSAIFVMIAGTYTPFTVLSLEGAWSAGLTAFVWSVAALGIGLRLLRPRWFERVSIGLYLALGWAALAALAPLIQALDAWVVVLLALGGILYTAGLAFHLWERLPFQNFIWHCFVVSAATLHYAAVVGSIA